jgi:hypothetical protein
MNDIQQAFLGMLLKVQDNLEDNALAYSSHIKIAPAKVLLDAQIQAIVEAAGRATENTTGVAEDKAEDRQALENVMYDIANGIHSYAKDTGNKTLANKVKYTKSDLQKLMDELLYEKAMRLNTYLTPVIVAELPNYNVAATDIANLPVLINNYFAAMPEVKDAIEGKTIGGNDVDRAIEASRKILEDLDGYVNSYRNNAATVALWEEYRLARAIDDNPSGGGGEVYEESVNPGEQKKVAEIEYNAATPVKFEVSGTQLNFALAITGAIQGSWVNVMPGTPYETTFGAMAPAGNELVVQNPTGTPGSYKVTIG